MQLRIPGPTPCPPEALEASGRQMINHRGKEFFALIERVTDGLKAVYQTKNDVFILTASGTGGLEAAVVNTLSPGDRVLSATSGVFGDRFADIAQAYGADVQRLTFEWGQPVDPTALEKALKDDPSIKTVFLTHNETSTGVTNDLKELSRIVKQYDKLLLVDAISSMAVVNLPTDEWDCDVVVSGSQKAYMVPPGLTMVSVSERAWKAREQATMPNFYWDFKRARQSLEKWQNPWTPAVSVIFALDATLKLMLAEGLPAIYERHAKVGQAARDGVKALGLELFARESHASNSVTAVKPGDTNDAATIVKMMREDHGIVLAGGQRTLQGKIFRIGHLGYVSVAEIAEVMAALADVLPRARQGG